MTQLFLRPVTWVCSLVSFIYFSVFIRRFWLWVHSYHTPPGSTFSYFCTSCGKERERENSNPEVVNVSARLNAASFLGIPAAVPSKLFSSDVIKHDASVPLPMSLCLRENKPQCLHFLFSQMLMRENSWWSSELEDPFYFLENTKHRHDKLGMKKARE